MALKDFIQNSFDRHYAALMRAVEDLTPEELAWRPGPESHSIGFVVWHYGRALDLWIQTLTKSAPQLWESEWAQKFNRPPDPNDLGFGYTAEQLATFTLPDPTVLLGYAEAMRANTMAYLEGLDDTALETVTMTRRDGERIPLAAMFEMLIWEVNQHGGQAAYIRGMQRGLGQ